MRKAAVLLLVVLVFSLVFYFGTFTLGRSESRSEVHSEVASSANATFNRGFCVYPDSPFGKIVAGELMNRGHKVLLLAAPVECDGQFLAVWVNYTDVEYSPVLSKGSIRVVAVYSSAGDPADYPHYRNSTGEDVPGSSGITSEPQVRAYLVVDVSDESKGLMGYSGYMQHLLKEAARAVVERVEGLSKEEGKKPVLHTSDEP
ncbi:hypothetical protein GQS_02690 [Thermococcus sp. 4557]|uniref:hypothetical protein n=1 Tax=Thermococcus sp. (strain CGMCC 1.5172 / 4557) TaxID=1042877 RepID=UPI000219EEB3|nr:hypothetical protein [Thermococcus sp. 4557]AEK72439.1 hypothetical protein GQS_02690 [Thermococcus sp. 4557]